MRDLRQQVDDELVERARELVALTPRNGGPDEQSLDNVPTFAWSVDAFGTARPLQFADPPLPIGASTRAVANGADAFFETVQIGNVTVRVLTVPDGEGRALQVARPIDDIDLHASHVVVLIFVLLAAATASAIGLGRLVARAALRPVEQLTSAAREMARTHDLSRPIEVHGNDELRGLAESMNSVVAALAESTEVQRQLVADASHELQTPLTALRANVDTMRRTPQLDDHDRRQIVDDLDHQLRGMSHLVTNLVDLARNAEDLALQEALRVDEVVADLVEVLPPDSRRVHIVMALEPTSVVADQDQFVSLVRNLVDNARAWSPTEGIVELSIAGGQLSVRDHGPGIAPGDLPRIFQRFYRAAAARDRDGSGLGLAIVDRVARHHGWQVSASNHPDGGAVFSVRFVQSGASADLSNGSAAEKRVTSDELSLRRLAAARR
jgi:two-component system sensor histidine kinase MprB